MLVLALALALGLVQAQVPVLVLVQALELEAVRGDRAVLRAALAARRLCQCQAAQHRRRPSLLRMTRPCDAHELLLMSLGATTLCNTW